jgi:hypothetical protein
MFMVITATSATAKHAVGIGIGRLTRIVMLETSDGDGVGRMLLATSYALAISGAAIGVSAGLIHTHWAAERSAGIIASCPDSTLSV